MKSTSSPQLKITYLNYRFKGLNRWLRDYRSYKYQFQKYGSSLKKIILVSISFFFIQPNIIMQLIPSISQKALCEIDANSHTSLHFIQVLDFCSTIVSITYGNPIASPIQITLISSKSGYLKSNLLFLFFLTIAVYIPTYIYYMI